MKCERAECEKRAQGYELFDYCALCFKNLCPEHMAEGCCGKKPAKSGTGAEADTMDDDDDLPDELVDEDAGYA